MPGPQDEDRSEHRDPRRPTATAPDSVDESLPSAAEDAGKTGPDAADPPRAAGKGGSEVPDGASTPRDPDELADSDGSADPDDPELDPDEGADAFETPDEARSNTREDGGERQDEDHITIDTPD